MRTLQAGQDSDPVCDNYVSNHRHDWVGLPMLPQTVFSAVTMC